jgi:anti-sigma regulatory factor (Ser/Thr protein kinase)
VGRPKDAARFPAVPASVAKAREFVGRRLTARECPAASIDAALVMVSELATNVLLHSRSPFSVEIKHSWGRVTVEVSDIGRGLPAIRAVADGGGFGLRIVDEMADDWGVRSELMGKTVYFVVPS